MRLALKTVLLVAGVMTFWRPSLSLSEPVHVSALSDDIVLEHLEEGGSLTTVSGDIRFEEAHALMRVSTISGDIKLGRLAGDAVVSSVSGDVSVGEAYKTLQVDAVSGDLRVDRVFGNAILKTVSGDIDVALGKDENASSMPRSLTLTTVSGDILFHLSQAFSGTIDVWARQNEREHQIPVVQSLGLKVELGPWEESGLSALGLASSNRSREIHVSGRLGDGTGHLVIHTTSGIVRLIQN
ncbi:DUF4097 family beta strand repeat-containing protein [Neokomagataea anthophila]|uniref:DUF4097 family beta strand repeat protein n=1 Tax=Neokomagataea anthophila TaxID=2826925 RepID=A0ABS5E9U1_9PROT|nr:DUF4097 family beta strand repeat-containing protein [Neokomagataea anthophila]MBR0560677.1 DUF4097 family beta strand repeat protein [Neokomagataea anthophila]